MVMHGTEDNLISVPHGEVLARELGGEGGGISKMIFEGRGHYLPLEERREFKRLIGRMVQKTEEL